jgi:hypothetical protein
MARWRRGTGSIARFRSAVPVGLEEDFLILACGHEKTMSYLEIDLILQEALWTRELAGALRCEECAKAWLAENAKEE